MTLSPLELNDHPAHTCDYEASVQDYIALLKPRVMSLVVFTGLVGIVVAPGHIHPLLAAVAVLCIALASGASGAINMWYERDVDALMVRTRNRPLPRGRMAPEHALEFGVVMLSFSVLLMGVALNWVAAGLLAFAAAFYVFVYTIWLKRRTSQNIVIGGAAGAFPPMIGWAAVTGDVGLSAVVLFALIFFWTPPHFWALALYRNDDYARAGIPMLPVVAGERATKIQMLIYTLLLLPLSLAPTLMGFAGWVYGATAILFSLGFIAYAIAVFFDKDYKIAKGMFKFSLLYLTVLFAVLLIEKVAGWNA
ncbi:MAG: protoheme IX farnesyltransferase [Alphaproteobacteria bacterium]|nr:protoheme IX farnesyltransferase [Alphaproteobacteria bacterium]